MHRFPLPLSKDFNRHSIRFVFVGASNVVLTYAVYLLLLGTLTPVQSILCATAAGIVYTSVLNTRCTFSQTLRPVLFIVVIVYYAIYTYFSATLLSFVIEEFSVPARFAPVPVMCVLLPIHFVCSRHLILRLKFRRP